MKTGLDCEKTGRTQRRISLGVCLVVVPAGVVTVYMRLRDKSALGDILPPSPLTPGAPFLSLLGLLLPFATPCSLPPAYAPVDQPPLLSSPPVSMIHA
jgi:hypothetical protein